MIDADPIAAAVRALMATRTEWTGTASELLGALAEMAGERIANACGGRLSIRGPQGLSMAFALDHFAEFIAWVENQNAH